MREIPGRVTNEYQNRLNSVSRIAEIANEANIKTPDHMNRIKRKAPQTTSRIPAMSILDVIHAK